MNYYIWENKKWTNFFWNEKKILPILSKVRLSQGKLINKVKSLKTEDSIKAQAEILISETIMTAQIEGERYSPIMVRSSIHRRLGLSYAGLPQTERHIEGLVEILLDSTSNFSQPLTLQRLKSWQATLFPTGYSGLKKIKVGELRDDSLGSMEVISGSIGKEKVHYQAPPAKNLLYEINNFLNWWNKSNDKIDGLIRAGIAHFYFITIHHFEDGNGRLARALTDLALTQDDKLEKRYYSLSAQIVENKNKYYQILENNQKGNSDLTTWLIWFLQSFEKSLKKSELLLQNIFFKTKFWRENQDIQINTRQRKIINKILDLGKGNFKGGLTTRKYVSLTKSSRATAYRELNDLLIKKILKLNKARGRSVSYDLNWDNY